MMLEKSIELKDMESVDSEYYNSLLWIKVRPAHLQSNLLMLYFIHSILNVTVIGYSYE